MWLAVFRCGLFQQLQELQVQPTDGIVLGSGVLQRALRNINRQACECQTPVQLHAEVIYNAGGRMHNTERRDLPGLLPETHLKGKGARSGDKQRKKQADTSSFQPSHERQGLRAKP